MEKLKKLWISIKEFDWYGLYRPVSVGIFIATIIGALCYVGIRCYHIGHAQGMRAGQCQVACAFLDMKYEFHDEEGTCWCASAPNAYYAIPVQKEF